MKKLLAVLFFMLAPAVAKAALCPSFPYTLTNGQTADANQVMANFNSLLSCLNTSVASAGTNSNITTLLGLTTPLSVSQGGTGGSTAVNSFNTRSGAVTLTSSDITAALGYTPGSLSGNNIWSGSQAFTAGLEAYTVSGPNYGVRVVGLSGGFGIVQFTDSTLGVEWGTISVNAAHINITSDAGSVLLNGQSPLLAVNNLSDLSSASSARSSLGLGNSATLNVGSTVGTVAAGNDARFGAGATAYADVNCTSGGCSINASFGPIASVTRTGGGSYTVNFSPALADTHYVAGCSAINVNTSCFTSTHATSSIPIFLSGGLDQSFDIWIFGS